MSGWPDLPEIKAGTLTVRKNELTLLAPQSMIRESEISSFVAWLRERTDFSQTDTDKIASLAHEYQRGKIGGSCR